MLSTRLLRDHPDVVRDGLRLRGRRRSASRAGGVAAVDGERRTLVARSAEAEGARARLTAIEIQMRSLALRLPNLPMPACQRERASPERRDPPVGRDCDTVISCIYTRATGGHAWPDSSATRDEISWATLSVAGWRWRSAGPRVRGPAARPASHQRLSRSGAMHTFSKRRHWKGQATYPGTKTLSSLWNVISLSESDGRGATCRASCWRNAARAHAATRVYRLYSVLPARGWLLWRGDAWIARQRQFDKVELVPSPHRRPPRPPSTH